MRFDHDIVTRPDLAKLMEAVDAKGAAGWELITVIMSQPPTPIQFSAFFKRPYQGPVLGQGPKK